MYGLITRLTTVPRRRESVIDVLAKRRQVPEGCLSYVVARDPQDPDTLWVTEVWTDAEAHRQSVRRPDIKAAFAGVLPWIATMHDSIVTEPVGGVGLGQAGAAAATVASTVSADT